MGINLGHKISQEWMVKNIIGYGENSTKFYNSLTDINVSNSHLDAEITVNGKPGALHLTLHKLDKYYLTCSDNRTGNLFYGNFGISLDNQDEIFQIVKHCEGEYKKFSAKDCDSVNDLLNQKRALEYQGVMTVEPLGYTFADDLDKTGRLSQFISQNAATYSDNDNHMMFVNENGRGALINDNYIVPIKINEDGSGVINVSGIQTFNQFDIDTGRFVQMVENSTISSVRTWMKTSDLNDILEVEQPYMIFKDLDRSNGMLSTWANGQDFRDFVMQNNWAYNIEDERGRPVITIITKDDYGDTEAFMIREKEDILSLSHMVEDRNGIKIIDFIDFGNDYDGHKELYSHLERITNDYIIESNDDFSLEF